VAPSEASAATAEHAVAPTPSTNPDPTASTPRSRNAATMPGTSVLVPRRRPPSSSSSVLTADTVRATWSTSSHNGIAARFNGMVSDSPRHDASNPSTNAASPASSTSCAV
jgi:hypothetical protein